MDIYASVEFGCVAIGEKNHLVTPDRVQVGCKYEARVPIVNMTRHRLRYYVKTCDQRPESAMSLSSAAAYEYEYEGLETEGTVLEEAEDRYENTDGTNVTTLMQRLRKTSTDNDDLWTSSDGDLKKMTPGDDDDDDDDNTLSFIEPSESINRLKNENADSTSATDPDQSSSFVFRLDKPTGELGPNEKRFLNLSFCPLKAVSYTVNAKCYLICNDFPGIVTTLPVVLEGSGCATRLKVSDIVSRHRVIYSE